MNSDPVTRANAKPAAIATAAGRPSRTSRFGREAAALAVARPLTWTPSMPRAAAAASMSSPQVE